MLLVQISALIDLLYFDILIRKKQKMAEYELIEPFSSVSCEKYC